MEYFLHPVSPTEAARIPFPVDLPLDQREAYMAKPPAKAIADAERWPIQAVPTQPVIKAEVRDGNR